MLFSSIIKLIKGKSESSDLIKPQQPLVMVEEKNCQTPGCKNKFPVGSYGNKTRCYDCKRVRAKIAAEKFKVRKELGLVPGKVKTPEELAEIAAVLELSLKVKKKKEQRILERAADILEQRVAGTMKLEDLGKKYGISRERVRQIEKIVREATGNEIVPERECAYCHKSFYSRRFKLFCNVFCGNQFRKNSEVHKQKHKIWYKRNLEKMREKRAAYRLLHPLLPRKCANVECGEMFMPNKGNGGYNQKFCGSFSKKTGCSYDNQYVWRGLLEMGLNRKCRRCGKDIPRKRGQGKGNVSPYCGSYNKETEERTGCNLLARMEYLEKSNEERKKRHYLKMDRQEKAIKEVVDELTISK